MRTTNERTSRESARASARVAVRASIAALAAGAASIAAVGACTGEPQQVAGDELELATVSETAPAEPGGGECTTKADCPDHLVCTDGQCVCWRDGLMQCSVPRPGADGPDPLWFCTDPLTDSYNCGACGIRCMSGTPGCIDGACSPCTRNTCIDPISGEQHCADLTSDVENCGFCGNRCPRHSAACDAATRPDGTTVWQCFCDPGEQVCFDEDWGDSCVNTASSPWHCGRCGNACPLTSDCVNGRCQPRPGPGPG
jgi:hypothetical protein